MLAHERFQYDVETTRTGEHTHDGNFHFANLSVFLSHKVQHTAAYLLTMSTETLVCTPIQRLASLLDKLGANGQSSGSEKVVNSVNEKLLKLATLVEIEIEKVVKASAKQQAKTAGLDQFFAEKVLLTGIIQSSVIYDAYSHYTAEHDLVLANTKEFSSFMNSKEAKRTISHNVAYYAASINPDMPSSIFNAASIIPDMPPDIFNAAIAFQSLSLKYSEQELFKLETKPWLIKAVSSFTSQCEQLSPDTITSADSFRPLLTVREISEGIDLPRLSEKNNRECSSPISLHLALGLGSLWLLSSPATWEEFTDCTFFTLLRQKYKPDPTPCEPGPYESAPYDT
jgi:hypothetical protein